MATKELNIKLKVDAAEVASGSQEAKNKVKDAANQMASDVKSSADKMEQSFDAVAKSTEGIKSAAKGATDSVKQMEQQVDASSKSMADNLEAVSKKMSAMQAFRMGSRGAQMVGGLAQNIAESYGASETAGAIGMATDIAGNASQGAAMGFAVAGPMGAVAGGLLGAADSLFKAGKDLQDAAKAQDEKAKDDLETRRREIVHQREVDKWSAEAKDLATAAYGTSYQYGTDEGKAAIGKAISDQRKRLANLTAQRDQVALNYDENGDIFAQAEKMRGLEEAIAYAAEKLNILETAANEAAEAERRRIEADEKAAIAAQESIEARKQEAVAIRRRQEEADEKERQRQAAENARAEAKAVAEAQKAEEKALKEEQREGEKTLADLQSQLNGVASHTVGGTTDSLTKIGGGVGYSSYNNSVEQVQKSIEQNLKQLIQNQTNQNQEIIQKLTDLTEKDLAASWK